MLFLIGNELHAKFLQEFWLLRIKPLCYKNMFFFWKGNSTNGGDTPLLIINRFKRKAANMSDSVSLQNRWVVP